MKAFTTIRANGSIHVDEHVKHVDEQSVVDSSNLLRCCVKEAFTVDVIRVSDNNNLVLPRVNFEGNIMARKSVVGKAKRRKRY